MGADPVAGTSSSGADCRASACARRKARYLRFGYPATDAQLSRYVDTLDLTATKSSVSSIERLELVAMAHLAHPIEPHQEGMPAMSEFGVSVLGHARRRGFGRRLFEHAMLHARNRGIGAIFIHALSENTDAEDRPRCRRESAARGFGDGSLAQNCRRIPLPRISTNSSVHAAKLDYRLKAHVQQVSDLLGLANDEHVNSGQKQLTRDRNSRCTTPMPIEAVL